MDWKKSFLEQYLAHDSVRRLFHPLIEIEFVRRRFNGVESRNLGDGTYEIRVSGYTLVAAFHWADCIRKEYAAWKYWYLPPDGLQGKTVLSAGCGCGEDMAFFFANGAKRVIGIELDPIAASLCARNMDANHWNAELHNEPFKVEHLEVPHDFLKMDIETAERALLDPTVTTLGPARIELHPGYGPEAKREASQIVRKFGLKHILENVWGTV